MFAVAQGAWEWLADIPHLAAYLTIAYSLYLVWIIGWIVLQKREPVATLSWVLSLAALPYLGLLIYYLLGPQKVKRQRLRRGRSRAGMANYSETGGDAEEREELARLAQAVTGLSPTTATSAEWLVDGASTYAAIIEAIRDAEHYVHLEYYIFNPDHSGTAIRDALIERARAGVKVRLLLDAVGSAKIRKRFLQPLHDVGGETAWFHPSQLLRPFKRPWINLRTHRKIVVVDGRVAFTGGINVTDEENESVRPDAYRDLHLRLEGHIVRSLQLVFLEDWIYATGQGRTELAGQRMWPDDAPGRQDGNINAQLVISGPDSSWEAIHRMYVASIYEAKERVWLVTPYFIPGEAARMALTSAALGGLDTRVLVPAMSDSRLVTYAARSYYEELLKAGVKVYEYGPRMLHTKALLVDSSLCMVGSANFDNRSFRLNFEVSMLFRDSGKALELAELFSREFASAQLVRLGQRVSLWRHQLPEAFARLMSPLL